MKDNQWEDHYTRLARKEHWRARSVYKLQEINQRFRVFRQARAILDLGCYPGSWSQYALKEVGPGGTVLGIDLTAPEKFPDRNFRFIQADVLGLDPEALREKAGLLDVVMSDLAPRTTGIKEVDAARSMDLVRKASEIASRMLFPGGHFICKVFEGEDFRDFRAEVAGRYTEVRVFRTGATRKKSREIYLIAKGFHP